MRIIVDAMGGDNAPLAPVQGAIQAAKEYGVDIVLVGRGKALDADFGNLVQSFLSLAKKAGILVEKV